MTIIHILTTIQDEILFYINSNERSEEMELINTKDLYENDAFVIIEAEFEDSETKKRMQEISLGLKNNQGDITKIRTIHRKQF